MELLFALRHIEHIDRNEYFLPSVLLEPQFQCQIEQFNWEYYIQTEKLLAKQLKGKHALRMEC